MSMLPAPNLSPKELVNDDVDLMSETNMTTASPAVAGNRQSGSDSPAIAEPPREKLTKQAITADRPTWCPGCGAFAVLAAFYNVREQRQLDHAKIVTLAGSGRST